MNESKMCPRCKTLKTIDNFKIDKTRKDGRKVYCTVCASYFYKRWDKNNTTQKQKKIKFINLLLTKKCIDCGEDNPVCLEFDHIRGNKISNISTMVSKNYTWDTILQEINKCDVRCSNCHQKRHAIEQGWYIDVCPSGSDLHKKIFGDK